MIRSFGQSKYKLQLTLNINSYEGVNTAFSCITIKMDSYSRRLTVAKKCILHKQTIISCACVWSVLNQQCMNNGHLKNA